MGSINATTDSTGAEVLRRTYRSYGELLGQTGTHTEPMGYIGQRTDGETANGVTGDKGLTYLHARYYDSALGVFLSPDPLAADRNSYRYSFGDSVNFSDPSGLIGKEAGDDPVATCDKLFPANKNAAAQCADAVAMANASFNASESLEVKGGAPRDDIHSSAATSLIRRAVMAGREAVNAIKRELTPRKDCRPVSLDDAKSAADKAAVILGMVNSSPTTAFGVVVAGLAVEANNHFGSGDMTTTLRSGTIEVQNFSYLRGGLSGWTMGNVVFLAPGADADTRAHERAHVAQGYDLGQSYTGAHLAAQGTSALASTVLTGQTDYATYNPLEFGPNNPAGTPSAYAGSLPVCQP